MGRKNVMEVKFYDTVNDELLKFAVIISQSNGKWVFCKHKERDTYEIRVTGLDENSFCTLHISIIPKTNRTELTLGAAIHPHAYAWGIPRLFGKKR